MENGNIFKTNFGYSCKVLMFDEKETFYEALHDNNEASHTKAKTLLYTRTLTHFFKENSTLISSSKLSEPEMILHRPDLPLRLNCNAETFWSPDKFDNIETFKEFLVQKGVNYKKFKNLNTNKIVIFPQGQQNSSKTPVLLECTSSFFDGLE